MKEKSARIVFSCLLIGCGLLIAVSGCSLLYRNRPPIASFEIVYPLAPDDPMIVVLDASGSTDPDEDAIISYRWLFGGDAEIITPLAYSRTVNVALLQVRYPEEGQYTVTLVVEDEQGALSQPVIGQVVLPHIEP